MDRSFDPARDFYDFATGGWRRANPIPADKVDWNAFWELRERNAVLLRSVAERARRGAGPPSGRRVVADMYEAASAMGPRDRRGFGPIRRDAARIAGVRTTEELFRLLGELHGVGVSGLFEALSSPDRRRSDRYAFYLWQGGLALPDRDYYLLPTFEKVREEYRAHVARMARLWGATPAAARHRAGVVLELETELARTSRSRAEERDVLKNYHRFERRELLERYPHLPWGEYLEPLGLAAVDYVVVGQPEFFEGLASLLRSRPLDEWKTYLTWHLLHTAAPDLHEPAVAEDFAFFHRTLQGQKEPEPLWRRAVRAVDLHAGEALGRLFVAEHFPPASRARMAELISDLKEVFAERLRTLGWMTEETRRKALAKFARFDARIGHPDRFRDYSRLATSPRDHFGNVRRARAFESRRTLGRVGGPVDRAEWEMTPPTVNAYFNPSQNEIFFPAGILQPPFFDPDADDAVNYGGIGCVIGHEITHGYDDQGRRFDEDGNLRDWWTAADEKEFLARARGIVAQYSAAEPLPGSHINGELTLGENIADFGGVSLAFEALERRLARDPSRRRTIDGLSPEQRFFLSYGQIWRQNCREEELRRRLTVDPHSPGRYRVEIPLRNLPSFRAAFSVPGVSEVPGASRGGSVAIW
jgi:putative endopeptidase